MNQNHCISCSTGKDASSCVVHLTNDGVVVNGYDVSIQFLGSRSVHSYLCKMDDGSFYACKNIAISKYMSIYKHIRFKLGQRQLTACIAVLESSLPVMRTNMIVLRGPYDMSYILCSKMALYKNAL